MRQSINALVKSGFMDINERKVNLKFYLGGDYKVSEIQVFLPVEYQYNLELTKKLCTSVSLLKKKTTIQGKFKLSVECNYKIHSG